MGFVGHGFVWVLKYINFYKDLLWINFMSELHLDSFIRDEACCTGEYILKRLKDRDFLQFWDVDTFLDLKKNDLIPDGMFVRTSNNGMMDKCYVVSFGELIGMHFDAYPLDSRIYTLEEVFAPENISDGYVLESRIFNKNFRKWWELNKK